jgi:hypothetical protein
MPKCIIHASVVAAAVLFTAACSSDTFRSTSAPSPVGTSIGAAGVTGGSRTVQSGTTTGLPLTAVVGSGSGTLSDAATASDQEGAINLQLTMNVQQTAPNTTLYLMRAGDVGLPNGQQSDGICQRANLGFFQPVREQPGGPIATLQTSNGGSGALHLELSGNDVPDGAQIDVVYRLVNALPPASPTIDLRTPCFTFTVK